ncbi:MAG: AMIN domain-containing protein [Candidatus Zixiibacteriota bacterium]
MNAPIRKIPAVATACTVLMLAATGAVHAADVRNLSLRHVGDFTELSVPVPARMLCDHFSQPAEADRPFRIVLNFCGAKHALPQKNFGQLPACMVREIRTSQYAVEPEPIVRVVLDLAGSATYSLRTGDDALTVVISDPRASAFASWEAVPTTAPRMVEHAEPAPMAASVVATERQTAPPSPRRERSMRPESDGTRAAVPAPAPAVDAEPTVVATAPPTTENVADPYLIPVPGEVSVQPSPPVSTSSEGAVLVYGPPAPMAPTETTPFELPAHPLVLAPEYLDAISAEPPAMSAQSDAAGSVVASVPETNPPKTDDKPQVWASVEGPATEPALAEPGGPKAGQPATESLVDRLKAKFFSNGPAPRPYTTADVVPDEQGVVPTDPMVQGPPTPAGSLDREALLERIRLAGQQAAVPTTVVSAAVGTERAEIYYSDLGRRDPFEPLLKGLRSGFLSDDLPSVETLRMVGVLRDEQGAMALLEDMEGHSYIMRAGDAVANGRVLSVGDQRVLFTVDEYGFTRTVALQLSARGSDPSKSLGAATQTTEPVPATLPE